MRKQRTDRESCLAGAKRLGLNLIALSHQDFNASLCLFKLFAAHFAQLRSLLKQFKSALERQLVALHLFYDRLKLLQASFEACGRFIFGRHSHHPIASKLLICSVVREAVLSEFMADLNDVTLSMYLDLVFASVSLSAASHALAATRAFT